MWPFLAFGSWFGVLATAGGNRRVSFMAWYLSFIMALIFVGLRHRVGTDWFNYLYMMNAVDSAKFITDMLSVCEPLYALLLKISLLSGLGIYLANVVTALVAMGGIFALARRMPEPWIAVLAAIPYLVVVIGMSANRQFLAIGILMYLVSIWNKTSLPMRLGWIILAVGFHKSAIMFLIFVILDMKIHTYFKFIGIFILTVGTVYYLDSSDSLDYYSNTYISGDTLVESRGAQAHAALTAVPAAMLFLIPGLKRMIPTFPIIGYLAYGSIGCFILTFFYSTVGDRLTLYFFAVPMFVWSSLPATFPQSSRVLVRFGIALIMNGLLAGWLLFANEAESHIPYENALTVAGWELDFRL
jgi:EpsG family